VPLIPYADVLMCTRGALRSVIPPSSTNALVLRCSGGQSILTELSRELIAVDIEDAIRLNACAITTQIYIGAEYEHQSIKNLVQLIDTGNRYGIPTMAVTGVGQQMKRDERYFGLATRIAAELGAHYVKSYFIDEGFERVVAGCPVPIVIAGGKKLPELDALTMAYKAIDQGAAGVASSTFAGLYLGGLYLATRRNLWLPILTHGFSDTIAVAVIFLGLVEI